ncbi:MAG TPA: PLP-dependent lyase/thiolase [Chthonomonadales bacterium]|nr:PLP-dependent lyase/thiolase [Chthonomonadales bacterium]
MDALTPLIRLCGLFPSHEVYAKCEWLAPSGCFKIRGARHLLSHLSKEGTNGLLVVPSMGNTALGAAVGATEYGFRMTGVVPKSISPDKDKKLRELGVELVKIDGGGSDLLRAATEIAQSTGGYFVHPHLDPLWTDGYRSIGAEILNQLPNCRSIVIPVGGGGLLLGLLAHLRDHASSIALYGCEPYNYPKYASFRHARSDTIADGLRLENPHPQVQAAIRDASIPIAMITETEIRSALRSLYETQALVVEPSSAITISFVQLRLAELEQPACVILTGYNIAADHHRRLIADHSGRPA